MNRLCCLRCCALKRALNKTQHTTGMLAYTLQAYEDESFVLPALLRFGGEPIVDEATGGLLYKFPSLQLTARDEVCVLCVSVCACVFTLRVCMCVCVCVRACMRVCVCLNCMYAHLFTDKQGLLRFCACLQMSQ